MVCVSGRLDLEGCTPALGTRPKSQESQGRQCGVGPGDRHGQLQAIVGSHVVSRGQDINA